MCVGCGTSATHVCSECVLTCFWCNDPGPYCEDCFDCQNNKNNKNNKNDKEYCGSPGYHKCWGCNEVIPLWEKKTQCPECDEGLFCEYCMISCKCGNKENESDEKECDEQKESKEKKEHFICNSDIHLCSYINCNQVVCENGIIECICGEETRWCQDHSPPISKSLRDEVIKTIK